MTPDVFPYRPPQTFFDDARGTARAPQPWKYHRFMSPPLKSGFVSLQLAFAERFSELGLGTISEGVHRLTNIQRRLGLGIPTDPPTDGLWTELLGTLEAASSHDDRVAIVMNAVASLPEATPEHLLHGWPTVGAFSIDRYQNVARTHFYSTVNDGESPLHPGKLSLRRRELFSVLNNVCQDHPEVDRVTGASWLYAIRSYSSLFPASHTANAATRSGTDTFRGMSHWGQFVDHRGDARPKFDQEFRRRLRGWHGEDLCALFPIPTLIVSSPLRNFDLDTNESL